MTIYKITFLSNVSSIKRFAQRTKVYPLSSCDWHALSDKIREELERLAKCHRLSIEDTSTNKFISVSHEKIPHFIDLVEMYCYKDFIYNRLFVYLI